MEDRIWGGEGGVRGRGGGSGLGFGEVGSDLAFRVLGFGFNMFRV